MLGFGRISCNQTTRGDMLHQQLRIQTQQHMMPDQPAFVGQDLGRSVLPCGKLETVEGGRLLPVVVIHIPSVAIHNLKG